MLKYLIISIRPKQWYKNSLLFVGIVFSANILNASMWVQVILAFVYFCMLSAGEYLINDLIDIKRDQKHPIKRKRPIASGQLKASYAILFALILIVAALLGSYLTVNTQFFIISAAYVLLTLLYSLVLKHLIIADVLAISIGFVLRAIAGCLAIGVFISPWLIVCTLLLALLLALGKRRGELVSLGEEAASHRASLSRYSTEMLNQLIGITTGASIVSYFMYTFFIGNYYMMITAPFVVYGLFRYLFLIHRENFGGEPEKILQDGPTLINIAIWALLVVLVLYKFTA
jgi:4-hydroxybenzoate polyprenyltransferase